MGRSLTLSAMLLLISIQLLLPPAALVSSAAKPSPKLSGFTVMARPWVQKVITSFLKELLQQGAYSIVQNKPPSGGGDDAQQQLGGAAATGTAALLVIDMSLGTPTPQNVSGLVDITSQLVWAQCSACATRAACAATPPPADTFLPNNSATFSPLPCSSGMCLSVLRETCGAKATRADCDRYIATYGPAVNTSGYLATDTFTFGSTRVPGVVFGCSDKTKGDFSGANGVIGLGRGPLSLISQLQLSRFSYQLWAPQDSIPEKSSGDDNRSIIRFGDEAVPKTKSSRSTPLLSSTQHPNLYYVNLTGILVDGKVLSDIPAGAFGLRANGAGGVVLSTTIPVTYLEAAAYRAVRQAMASRISLQPVDGSALLGLDLCYAAASMGNAKVPSLVLAFDGGGTVMELAVANYFLKDNDTGLECLTMLPSRGVSVLGSLLQAGTNMIYDVDGERLTFERPPPSKPQPPRWVIIVSCVVVVAVLIVIWFLYRRCQRRRV